MNEDDAARVNWGGKWQIPSKSDFENLRKYCTWESTTQNGQFGFVITGKNGNRIFLPAVYDSLASYWTNGLDQTLPYNAYTMSISSTNNYWIHCTARASDKHVRPVIK